MTGGRRSGNEAKKTQKRKAGPRNKEGGQRWIIKAIQRLRRDSPAGMWQAQ